jgi:uncharacterized membrane protein YjjB (DUF3815 family)
MGGILIEYLINAIFAAIPAIGFGMVFNVPKNTLIYCGFGGAIAYTSRAFLMNINISIELATFIASTIVGVVALYWSRKYIIPRPVYTIASIIPLLPGTYAFSAVIELINMNAHGVTPELISIFVENSLKTITILGGIGFGLAIPSIYFMRYNRAIA